MEVPPRMNSKQSEGGGITGLWLGIFLITILVGLLSAAWIAGMSTDRPPPPGPGPVFMGMFLVALGLMFLSSYYLSEQCFFLRWLLKLSMAFPGANNRKMAFLFSFICTLVGIGAILDGSGFSLL